MARRNAQDELGLARNFRFMARIGQYQIGELLGEGGLGRVHAAHDVVLGREVAIKSLRPEFLNDAGLVARFRAEATNLARLNHPNITTIHTLLEQGRSLYIVMERVYGETLDGILRRHKRGLSLTESLSIMAQTTDGLAYAHSMGIIHRDIKPSNLMIVPSSGLVKIMDFGIARLRGSQNLTRDGSIIGTLAYMAPEQLRGEQGDERSDLYSLAVVLYEMLTGSAPFVAKTEYDLIQAQVNTKPPHLRSVLPDASPKLEAALERALAKKPEHRFASVSEFRDAIDASAGRLTLTGAPSKRTGLEDTGVALRASIERLGATAARLLPAIGAATARIRPAGMPARGSLAMVAAATALIAFALVWGAVIIFSGTPESAVAKRPPPGGKSSPVGAAPPGVTNKSASTSPVGGGTADPGVIMLPPRLYPGRTELDKQDRE
jgi:serine/threonine protein kinase